MWVFFFALAFIIVGPALLLAADRVRDRAGARRDLRREARWQEAMHR